jgi:hypothetical protein
MEGEDAGGGALSPCFVSIVSFVSETRRNGIERASNASNPQILREDSGNLL